LYISSFMKIGRGVSELWRVENRPLPLTWPYNSLYYRTSRDICRMYTVSQKNKTPYSCR